MNSGLAVLSCLLLKDEIRPLLEIPANVSEWFADAEQRRVFEWAWGFYKEHGSVPGTELLQAQFPDFRLPYVKEPMSYWLRELGSDYTRAQLNAALIRAAEQADADPRGVLDLLRREMARLALEIQPTRDVNMSLDVDERWHRYERRRRGEDDSVWHYPWPTIDSVTDGINPTELVLITARPGVGKTWALCCILDNLVRSGARTLLISTEMSVSAIERRIDAVHFGLDFEAFRSGLLPDHLTKKYREGLEEFRSLSNAPIVVGDEVLTPAAIDAKYQQYKPDVILVDGLYLLRDDEGARDLWARTTNVSRGLKVLAKRYTIPVIATTQLHRPAARMAVDRIGLDNLAYSDALSQDADVVIGMYANKNLLSEHARLLRILKAREGVAPTPTKIAFRPGADLSDITPQEGVDQEDIQADDDQVDF